LNAAEGEANKASELPSLAEPVARPEQREQHRRRLFNLRRSRNVVVSQRDGQLRNLIQRKVEQGRFRRRVASDNLSLSGSVHRRL
jgi:hypothetical protein